MNLLLERTGLGSDSTLGQLFIDGEAVCSTIEDERRRVKVPGETCIPEGRYRITLRREGGFHARYARRFPEMHRGMLWLRDVPGFRWILIHCGNTDDHTAGCLVVGARPVVHLDHNFSVAQSEVAYRHVYPRVVTPLEAGKDVWITVRVRGLVDEPAA